MPYAMVHLGVAHLLTKKLQIKLLPDFYIGASAPDAVHLRENYGASKNISHLRDHWKNYHR